MRPVTSIMSDLQVLLDTIGSQIQRDFREIMRLRKMHGRPRNYARNTLPIIYKIIERYQKEHVSPFVFMTKEDWENYEEAKPLYVCVVNLCGFENILRGLPLYCITLDVYYRGSLTYAILYEPPSQVVLGAETKGSCYVLGGAQIRGVHTPENEPMSYVLCSSTISPIEIMDMYIVREPTIAALWVVMSRVSAAVVPKEHITPGLRLLINAGQCFTKSFDNHSIFGVKEAVIRLYDALQGPLPPPS